MPDTTDLQVDFIHNDTGYGDAAERFVDAGMDPGALRPWYSEKYGGTYVTLNQNGVLRNVRVSNTTYTLRQDAWKAIDAAVLRAAAPYLRGIDDLRSRGLVYSIANGMGKTSLQTELMSDVNDATVSMDPIQNAGTDRVEFEPVTIPLPVIHKGFYFSARQIAESRNGGTQIDTATAEACSRKVAEAAEKMLIGKWTPAAFQHGGGKIEGYTNFTDVLTQTMTAGSAEGWTGTTFVNQVLAMMQSSRDAYYYGPWMLYHSPNWAQYLDRDYSTSKGDNTVRQRVKDIDGIEDCKQLNYLTGWETLLVQMTSDVVRLIDGLGMTTVQWDTHGGMRKHFEVMAIWVPQLRSDINDRTGIVYGSA